MRCVYHLVALLTALFLPLSAQAGLIRDAEIENTLYAYARPIFVNAKIDPDSVRILIMDSPEINSYVAGGLNIFINTGLILQARKPGMVIGVLAHETGHIAGAHLSQFQEKANRATLGSVLGMALGAAAVAGGGKQAGAGIMMGAQNMAQRSFLTDIRMNEEAADHAALTFLDASDISATGMIEMFEVMRQRESGLATRDKYLTNHPLTPERISTMRNHITQSRIPAGQVPEQFLAMHTRMLAKLTAFTGSYDDTLKRYPLSDNSVAARYARAIAEFRRSRLVPALSGMDALIKQYPNDPYFYDTRGQILFENGKLDEAAASYAKAMQLKPDSALITTEYAKTLIARDKPDQLALAVTLLERAKELDDSYDVTWRQLAIAYGKQGKLGHSYEALAEESALAGDYESVIQHVARARANAQDDPALSLQLNDLERDAKAQLEKKRRDESIF